MAQITRMRFEASGEKAEEVHDLLISAAEHAMRDDHGGSWIDEEPGLTVIPSKTGFWGRMTVRRKDDKI